MKEIKNTIYAILLFAMVSCSLKETPEHFVDRSLFYRTEMECRSVLNSAYNKLNGIFNHRFFYMTELQSDLWYNTASGTEYDATLDITPSSPGHGVTIWTNCYNAIMICNECIECIADAPIESAVKDPMVAEARVLRALYYHILTQVFNGVPFYLESVDSKQKLEEIRRLPRTEAGVIRETLYDDLKDNVLPVFTEDSGLRKSWYAVGNERAGYALALYLMGNFAMWNQEWQDALEPLLLLKEIYGEIEDYPLKETLWSIANTPESIFEIQHNWSVNGVQYYSNLARLMMPPWSDGGTDDEGNEISLYGGIDMAGFAYKDEIMFRRFADRISTSTSSRCSKRVAMCTFAADGTIGNKAAGALFSPLPVKPVFAENGSYTVMIDKEAVETGMSQGKKIDKRVFYTIGLGNYTTGEAFNVVSKHDYPYAGPKFWCPDMVQSYDSNNYKIYRYADAVLMLAECYAGLGNVVEGDKYLNSVRARAGVDALTHSTPEELMSDIRDERARELAGEFHRKFDLVRWGIWYDYVQQYSEKGTLTGNCRKCHRYYPIPDTECALSGYVITNDEYNAE